MKVSRPEKRFYRESITRRGKISFEIHPITPFSLYYYYFKNLFLARSRMGAIPFVGEIWF